MSDQGSRATTLPLVLTSVAGVGISLQSFITGRLGLHLGSAEIAGTATVVVAAIATTILAASTGLLPSVVRSLRVGPRPRWQHLAAGAIGGLAPVALARAAPELGIALLTVALVCGQTTASLGMDAAGIGPGGRRPVTLPRVLGVALVLFAVTIGALGSSGDLQLGLIAVSILAGAALAISGAALGHVAATTGSPVAANAIVTPLMAILAIVSCLAIFGLHAPGGWSAPPHQWLLGGVIGATVGVVVAKTVGRLGVLRMSIALIAGQSVGALVIDLFAPVADHSVTGRTIAAVVLCFLAVAVSGLQRREAQPPARVQPAADGLS